MLTTDQRKTLIHVSGMDIELERRGKGQPLLLLYGEEGLEPEAPFIDELAKDYEVFMPSPPGFGNSERPDWIRSLDDVAYIYLDLIEKLALKNVPVVGFSLGGWLAAEIATKDDSFISKLALVDPYGIKVGGPYDRDIADFWCLPPSEVLKLKWHDTEKGKRDFPSMSEEKLTVGSAQCRVAGALLLGPFHAQPDAEAPPASHQGADPRHLGRARRHRHSGLRQGLCRCDPRRDVPDYPWRRTSAATRTTRSIHGGTARILALAAA